MFFLLSSFWNDVMKTWRNPTSASCDLAMSTNVLAAGWTMSNSFIIVAPSLDIVALPETSKSMQNFGNYKYWSRSTLETCCRRFEWDKGRYRTPTIHDQFVHAPGSEGGTDCIHDGLAGIDVADELWFALGGVCALLEEDDWRLLKSTSDKS